MRCVALVLPAIIGLCYAGVNDDNGGNVNAAQGSPNNNGGSSQGYDAYGAGVARIQPQIIPVGVDDSGEGAGNNVALTGNIPAQSGGTGNTGMYGGIPPQSGAGQAAAAAGDSSNSIDGAGTQYVGGNNERVPNAGAVAGADAGLMAHQDLQSSSGMSGAAVAGVVAGVVVVGAVGTAVAVVALKSSASPFSPA